MRSYSFIVFKYVIIILWKNKYILGRMCLIFGDLGRSRTFFFGIWGAKANTFRESRTLFAGRLGDQCIIFRDQGSTDPPPPHGGLHNEFRTDCNSCNGLTLLERKILTSTAALETGIIFNLLSLTAKIKENHFHLHTLIWMLD